MRRANGKISLNLISGSVRILCVLVRARNVYLAAGAYRGQTKGLFPARLCQVMLARSGYCTTSFDTQNIVFAPLFGACWFGFGLACESRSRGDWRKIALHRRDMNFKFSLALAFCDVARVLARAKNASNNKAAHVSPCGGGKWYTMMIYVYIGDFFSP